MRSESQFMHLNLIKSAIDLNGQNVGVENIVEQFHLNA